MHFLSTHYYRWSLFAFHFWGKLRPRDEGSDLIMTTMEDKDCKPKLTASRASLSFVLFLMPDPGLSVSIVRLKRRNSTRAELDFFFLKSSRLFDFYLSPHKHL